MLAIFTDYFHKQAWKTGNDVIHILTSEDMENTPQGSRTSFRMNFASDVFSSSALVFNKSLYNSDTKNSDIYSNNVKSASK